jgi:hypothetical protein
MKKLLLILLLASSFAAHAQTWEGNNTAGGKIVLTSRDCPEYPNKGLRSGYSFGKGGKTYTFCWAFVDYMVKALYKNGDEYTYDPQIFSKVTNGKSN